MKYKVIKQFKSHCVCHKILEPGEEWSLFEMTSKKRAYIKMKNNALHKVKLSRALTNSKGL